MSGDPIRDGAVEAADDVAGRREAARSILPALVMVVVVGAAAAGVGLLVPAATLDHTGMAVVRVAGLGVALVGVVLLCGPWRSPARIGPDALPAVLALAAGVIAVLALMSLPTSPIDLAGDRRDQTDDPFGGGETTGRDPGDTVDEGNLVVGDDVLAVLDVDGDGVARLGELDVDGDGRLWVDELDRSTGDLVVAGVDFGDFDAGDFDLDGDGVVEIAVLDADGDGVVELDDLDTDGDGLVRLEEVDLDGDSRRNGEVDLDARDDQVGLPRGDDDGDPDGEQGPAGGAGDQPVEARDRDDPDSNDDSGPPDLSGLLRGLLIVGLVVAGALAILWARDLGPWRPRQGPPLPTDEEPPVDADAAQAGLSASLATVAAGDDPRAAIVQAYLRLLDVLAEAGGPRRPHEAPHEHLHRVLGPLGVRPEPTHGLAELFVMARFSPHPVQERHRDEAAALLNAALADLAAHLAATTVPEPAHAP